MKIKKVYIENFRSIQNVEISCTDRVILVGRNSVGKSNILMSLDVFFNVSDKILSSDMLCSFPGAGDEIIIELTFGDLTESEKNGRLKKYICPSLGPGLQVRKVIKNVEGKLRSNYHGWVEEPEEKWLKTDFRDYRKQAFWKQKGIDFFAYTSAQGGQISKDLFEEFRQTYIEKHRGELSFDIALSETEFEGFKSVGMDMLPQFCFVPAVGDVSEIVAGSTKSLLARMVGEIVRSSAGKEEVLRTAQEGLEMAAGLVNREGKSSRLLPIELMEKWLKEEFKEWGTMDFEISTSFPEIHTLLTQNLKLLVDDGDRGDISTKGHGLQRQMIFKIIRLNAALKKGEINWINLDDKMPETPSIILAFEEPELYLHPQAQLSFYEDIGQLSNHDQIFLCTHSTHLVDIVDFEGIKILYRETLESPTTVCECKRDIFGDLTLKKSLSLAKLFDANVNKLFFADKIVVVEGDEELIGIVRTAKEYANCFSHRVTIVNAKGKHQIPSLQRVLNAFRISYTVVYDVDPGNTDSELQTKRIEELVGETAPFGIAASMPMNPDFATELGYGENKDKKEVGCVEFLDRQSPNANFIEKVMNLYKLPKAGIITPK